MALAALDLGDVDLRLCVLRFGSNDFVENLERLIELIVQSAAQLARPRSVSRSSGSRSSARL